MVLLKVIQELYVALFAFLLLIGACKGQYIGVTPVRLAPGCRFGSRHPSIQGLAYLSHLLNFGGHRFVVSLLRRCQIREQISVLISVDAVETNVIFCVHF